MRVNLSPRGTALKVILSLLGVGVSLAVCEFAIPLGIKAGAIVWLPVLAAAWAYGWRYGALAAVPALAGFYFVCVGPINSFQGDDYSGLPFLSVAMGSAIALIHARKVHVAGALVVVLWNEAPSGDYWADCARGEMRADAFIHKLTDDSQTYMLGWIARDMIGQRRFAGAEIGFFDRLSRHMLGRPSQNANDNPQNLNGKLRVIRMPAKNHPCLVGDE